MPGINIFIDSSGAKAGAREVKEALRSITPSARKVMGAFDRLRSSVNRVKQSLFSLRSAVAGIGFGMIVRDIVRTSNAFQSYRKTLDTLEGSHSRAIDKWEELLKFAQDTPFRIDEVTKSYMTLKAYGLDPTIEAMRALGDTAAAFGDKDIFRRVAFALGQIHGAGKLMMQDLNQLTQAGINVNEALKKSFNVTRKDIDKINAAITDGVIKIEDVYDAFISYMQSKFGGQMQRMMDTLKGQWEALISYIQQVEDKIMASGLGSYLTSALKAVNQEIEKLKVSGKLDEWAKSVSDAVISIFEKTALGVASIYDTISPILSEMGNTVHGLWAKFKQLPTWAQEIGVVGAFILGRKGAVALVGALTIMRKIRQWEDEQATTHPLIMSQLFAKSMQPGTGKTYLKSKSPYKEPEIQKHTGSVDVAYAHVASQAASTIGPLEAKVRKVIQQLHNLKGTVKEVKTETGVGGGLIFDASHFEASAKVAKLSAQLKKEKKMFDALTLASLPAHERQIEMINMKYSALGDTLEELYAKGYMSHEQYSNMSLKLYTRQQEELKQLAKLSKKTADTTSQFWIQAFRSMQQASSDFFFDVMQGNFKGLLSNFKNMLDRMVADWVAAQLQMALWGGGGKAGLISQAISFVGGLASSYYGGGGSISGMASTNAGNVNMSTGAGWAANSDIVSSTEQASFDVPWYAAQAHSGWYVGHESPSALRLVPSSLFIGASRFHNGLNNDEFPAILRRGEKVIPPGSENGRVNINIVTPPGMTAETEERKGASGEVNWDIVIMKVEDKISNNVARGKGSLGGTLQNVYGLSRGSRNLL